MTTFERKYTADEKEAALHAAIDRRIKPQRAVVELAKRGELVTLDGRQVRPFELNPYTLRSWVNIARRKRNGRIPGAAYENPEGTIDALRKRLIALADSELAHCERQRTGKRNPEHMRQIARLLREAAAIPAAGQGRGRKPGQVENGQKQSGETTGGLAGSLLAAHRRAPAPEPPAHTQAQRSTVQTQRNTTNEPAPQPHEPHRSGSLERSASQ